MLEPREGDSGKQPSLAFLSGGAHGRTMRALGGEGAAVGVGAVSRTAEVYSIPLFEYVPGSAPSALDPVASKVCINARCRSTPRISKTIRSTLQKSW